MQRYLFKNILVVNEGNTKAMDVLIAGERIEKIAAVMDVPGKITEINGEGKYLLPGVIDNHVHFREPGLTFKGGIYQESKAAVAGGVTSFMDMPNTIPPTFTQQLLEEKFAIAAQTSLANYSFYMGTSNDNADEALRTNDKRREVCGIKIFMGSSTGNLLLDNPAILDKIFAESQMLIATHCEDERIMKQNYEKLKVQKPELTAADHPIIKNEEACFESSLYAIQLAKKHNSRLHILHITTAKELALFSNMLPLAEKRITCEACVHHLHYTSDDYALQGNKIKCNPAIKAPFNKAALWEALLDDRIDAISTDHAPHTIEEKNEPYEKAHGGVPFVQHSLPVMLYYAKNGKISIEKVVEKMSHNNAILYNIAERGFIREGYYADLAVVNMNKPFTVSKENILYKCGWSPLENFTFPASVEKTFVNGTMVYGGEAGWNESAKGKRLLFDR
ncbi:MAG TPA: dihydroorotase [Ferruginibacter sp.]|nr:dihydroorotase [Ferruginibacter sp.]HMP20852.1 dihydroorotase [Ferruginibacter sp.]